MKTILTSFLPICILLLALPPGTFAQDTNWKHFYYLNYSGYVADDSNYVWVATGFNTLSRFNKNDGSFETLKRDGRYDPFVPDKKHRLWFNDNGELSMYDGRDFSAFEDTPIRNFWNIDVDTLGHIWFSKRDTLVEFDGTLYSVYTSSNCGLPPFNINDIEVDKHNNIWLATDGGLVKFDRAQWTTFDSSNSTLDGSGVICLTIGYDDKVYAIQRYYKLHIFNGNTWSAYPSYPPYAVAIYCITSDQNGNVYMGGGRSGIIKFDGVNYTQYHTSYYGQDETVWELATDAQGNVWAVGRGYGLTKLTPTDMVFYGFEVPSDEIFCMDIDRNGNKWTGTDLGLAKFDGHSWSTYNFSNSGLPANYIAALAFDKQDHLWLGVKTPWDAPIGVPYIFNGDSLEGGLVHYNGADWTVYHVHNSNLPSLNFRTIYADKDGIVWIGTSDAGLLKFDGTTFHSYTPGYSVLTSLTVNCITSDQSDKLWIGTATGLVAFDQGVQTRYDRSNSGLPSNNIRKVAVDSKNNKWIATDSGLVRFDGKNWKTYNPTNSPMPAYIVRTVEIDYSDRIWLATQGVTNDLLCFDGGKWNSYNIPASFSYTGLSNFMKTDTRNVWLAMEGHVLVFNKNGQIVLDAAAQPPESIKLNQNFPNPFNPETTIRYDLPEDGKVTLKIYNILGQEIRTLINNFQLAGSYETTWNGTNHHGKRVASGMYFYRLQAGKKAQTKKLLLVK